MLSIDLIINNKLENASKNLIPFYWENDAIMKFKQKLIRAHKFVVGMEFFFFIEAIENYLIGKDTLEHIQEEMGDVSNLICQFEEHWNDGKVHCWKELKIKRQIDRIKKEQK